MSRFLKYDLIFSFIVLFFVFLPTYADTTTLVEDFSFGGYGEGDGQFDSPVGIAIGPDGTIYVTDYIRDVVQAFSSNGTFITKWGGDGSSDGKFLWLWGVAVSLDGSVYNTDEVKDQVQQFTGSGTFIRSFGTSGSDPGELDSPLGIAVNSTGYVFVADHNNNRIEIFTADGEYYDSWNTTTGMPSDFLEPFSIAIDSNDNIYVGLHCNKIYCFLPDKTLLQSWQNPYRESVYSCAISVGPDGYLYAVDNYPTVYRYAMDGSIYPLQTGGNYGLSGIAVDEENGIFCTDVSECRVIRFVQGTKTPGMSVPYLAWSDPLTEEWSSSRGYDIFMTVDGGSIETGEAYNESYLYDIPVVKRDGNGAIQWIDLYGGEKYDYGQGIIGTGNGNYAVIGYTNSNLPGYHAGYDVLVMMLNADGTLQWEQCYGGSGMDYGRNILETSDGNFILVGQTYSDNGDVSGRHGSSDIWVVKIDPHGEIIWQKCFGGSNYDTGYHIIESENGGFILTGFTESDDGDVSGNHGDYDIWVVKIDADGEFLWQKCYGGTDYDYGRDIIRTDNGGYLLTGYTYSDDGDISGNHGATDLIGIKIDLNGEILWQKCYGGTDDDYGYDAMAYNGGYTFVGYTKSYDDDIIGYHGQGDAWVVQTDAQGNLRGTGCFGGSSYDIANSGISRGDGTYLITGRTNSRDGDVSDPDVDKDLWTFMIDEMESDFSASTQSGTAPLTVTFTGWTSSAMKVDSCNWYFGDGGISHEQNPVHQYTAPGIYTVRMEVAGSGFTGSMEKPGYIIIT